MKFQLLISVGQSTFMNRVDMKLPTCECEEEKMAFFTEGDEFVGAVSYASDFLPSEKGVLIHFNVDEIEPTLETILKKGGKVVIPRTKIEAEGRGYFAVFVDTEGNRVGIYADK